VTGLPLGSTEAIGCSAMINLIGELPNTRGVLQVANVHLHLYGKAARPGRKLGHVTVHAANPEGLAARIAELRGLFPAAGVLPAGANAHARGYTAGERR